MELYNSTVEKILGIQGRMISGSKSGYRRYYPDNLVVFNSYMVVVTKTGASKVWFGDVDITLDREKLKQVAKELDATVFIIYEMDGRFENENSPVLSRYVYSVDRDGMETLGDSTSVYFEIGDEIKSRKNQ
jgi:hypothetical protein